MEIPVYYGDFEYNPLTDTYSNIFTKEILTAEIFESLLRGEY